MSVGWKYKHMIKTYIDANNFDVVKIKGSLGLLGAPFLIELEGTEYSVKANSFGQRSPAPPGCGLLWPVDAWNPSLPPLHSLINLVRNKRKSALKSFWSWHTKHERSLCNCHAYVVTLCRTGPPLGSRLRFRFLIAKPLGWRYRSVIEHLSSTRTRKGRREEKRRGKGRGGKVIACVLETLPNWSCVP